MDSGITYIFIRGALIVEDMEVTAEHIEFLKKYGKRYRRTR